MLTKKSTKNEHLRRALEDFGLSPLESGAYLALLPLGVSTILKLSKHSDIKRTSLYHVVQGLIDKGLIRKEIKGFKEYISAQSPTVIPELINLKKQKIVNFLPALNALHKLGESESGVGLYEGAASIIGLYNSLLDDVREGDNYYVISDDEKWFAGNEDYFQKFTEKRGKMGANIKLLLTSSTKAKEHKKYEKNFGEQIKILPANFTLNQNIIITKGKVIFHELSSHPRAIALGTKSVALAMESLFELIWKIS